jgi:regulator of sigma E protease
VGLCVIPLFALISGSVLWSILLAAIGLGFVIFVHELGHFMAAKACGVKCEKFYIGFDVPLRVGPLQLPRALFRKQVGETEYGIGIIPLGGYVKMLGQDDNPANAAKEAERIRVAREQAPGDQGAAAATYIDPRSYPAKTVPQRLLIISAGVIMNLIFAVIFGMVAYRMGVIYTPCLVGSTSPGLSAWEVGFQTGDRIVQLGRDGIRSPHLRFDKDLMVKVMMTGANRDLDVLVEPYSPPGQPEAEPEWTTVHLSDPQEEQNGRPIIGISPYGSTQVATSDEVRAALAHLSATQAVPPLENGDQIVAVDGQIVEDYAQLSRQLAQKADAKIQLTVRRSNADAVSPGTSEQGPREIAVQLQPQPMRWLGLGMRIGPIVAVQRGSPADQAGLRPGDQITQVAGQPVDHAAALPVQLRRLAGQEVPLTVVRPGSAEPLSVTVRLRDVQMLQIGIGAGSAIDAEALGVAFPILNQVASVAPGTPAATAGLRPGDIVEQVQFVPGSAADARLAAKMFPHSESIWRMTPEPPVSLWSRIVDFVRGTSKPVYLSPEDWAQVDQRVQLSMPGTTVRVTYSRDGMQGEAELVPLPSDDWNVADRGLKLAGAEELHQESNWLRSLQLGLRETVESMRQVYFILHRLVTGQMSVTNLGGPASIATMAGMEAHAGIPRLLVFLTLLSANLAVINFLPIPVLDGGHAMFLLYEGIFRRPVNERVAFGLTMAGLCLILGLMLFVIGLDVWRLSGMAG